MNSTGEGARAFHPTEREPFRRATLRALAVAIAIAAAIDPAISIVAATRPRIAVVVQNRAAANARRIRDELVRDLAGDYDIVPQIASDTAAAIVIGDRYPDESIAGSLRVWTVTMTTPADGVRIVRASAPREVLPATTIRIDVDLDAQAAAGRTTELRARVAGVESGLASHRWSTDEDRWHASLDVVPVGEPPFVVRLEAATPSAGATAATATSAADLVINRRTTAVAVEFFDARPSWASTFVRRALEADPRFRVESVSVDSRGLSARTAGAVPLADRRLDEFDGIVVGGLDRLSSADVAALDRYLRERGGAVVLLPDQRIASGPLTAWLPASNERLLERPASLVSTRGGAALRASELLVTPSLPVGSDVLTHLPGDEHAAIVVTLAHGDGRLLVSGAMDAWRYRATADAAFDHFWQSTIAGLGLVTPPAIDTAVMPPLLQPRQTAEVVVRVRGGGDAMSVSASADGQPIRLLPEAERGLYRGTITGGENGPVTSIEVHAADDSGRVQSARHAVPIAADTRPAAPIAAPLSLVAMSHRGIDLPPSRAGEIAQAIREGVRLSRAPAERRPMRSPWWIAPFIGCLSGEWWLRRRRGLR